MHPHPVPRSKKRAAEPHCVYCGVYWYMKCYNDIHWYLNVRLEHVQGVRTAMWLTD
jgi:hypothetical protein